MSMRIGREKANNNNTNNNAVTSKMHTHPSAAAESTNNSTAVTSSTNSSSSSNRSSQEQDKSHALLPTSTSIITGYWKAFTHWLHHDVILAAVLALSLLAAKNPKQCIALVITLSLTLIGIGAVTNVNMSVSEQEMFTPWKTSTRAYAEYIGNVDQFTPARPVSMLVHAEGDNVLGDSAYRSMDLVLKALDIVQTTDGYQDICNIHECRISCPAQFWNSNYTQFKTAIATQEQANSNAAVQQTLSQSKFPNGAPAFHHLLMGFHQRDNSSNNNANANATKGIINYAQSLLCFVFLPDLDTVPGQSSETNQLFEQRVIDRLMEMTTEMELSTAAEDLNFEFWTLRSIPDELVRAIQKDLPLIPMVFGIMMVFCCLVFVRKDRIQSRTLLGVGSIVTIVCSMMTGYGLLFICGVPFTNMTQILPFVIFGIGLGKIDR